MTILEDWRPFRRHDCRTRYFVLMHSINSRESSGRFATLVSKLNAGIVPLGQHYIFLDEQPHTTVISRILTLKWITSTHPSLSFSHLISCFLRPYHRPSFIFLGFLNFSFPSCISVRHPHSTYPGLWTISLSTRTASSLLIFWKSTSFT